MDASTEQMILSVASPIYDENGTVLGVAGMDIAMDQIMAVMEQHKIGENGYIMLLSAEGFVVYHPQESEIQKNITEMDISQNVITAVESGEEEFLQYSTAGVTQYGYITPVGTTGYLVISSLPLTEYYMQLIVTLVLLVVIFIAGIIRIAFGMRKTATRITKPIVELNKTKLHSSLQQAILMSILR